MDILRKHSIEMTQRLQQTFGLHKPQTEILRFWSSFYDTEFVYWWIYPLLSLVNPLLGKCLIYNAVTVELLINFMKLFFRDDRPYWWFNKLEYSTKGAAHNTLYEFPETCEITSGFPSITTGIFGAASFAFLSYAIHRIKKSKYNKLSCIFFIGFILFNGIGILSRIFIAANFHYQLVTGLFIGIKLSMYGSTKQGFGLLVDNSLKLVLGSGLLVILIGFSVITPFDTFWSIVEGMTWCWNTHRIYPHLKFNPVFYAARLLAITTALTVSKTFENQHKKSAFALNLSKPMVKIAIGGIYLTEILILKYFISQIQHEALILEIIVETAATFLHVVIISVVPTLFLKPSSSDSASKNPSIGSQQLFSELL